MRQTVRPPLHSLISSPPHPSADRRTRTPDSGGRLGHRPRRRGHAPAGSGSAPQEVVRRVCGGVLVAEVFMFISILISLWKVVEVPCPTEVVALRSCPCSTEVFRCELRPQGPGMTHTDVQDMQRKPTV